MNKQLNITRQTQSLLIGEELMNKQLNITRQTQPLLSGEELMNKHAHRQTHDLFSLVIRWVKKGKGFPCSLPSIGPGTDPNVQAVSPQVTISHPPSGRLPLLSARPVVTFPATEHQCLLAGKLYCSVTEAHRCEPLAQGCYAAFAPSRI